MKILIFGIVILCATVLYLSNSNESRIKVKILKENNIVYLSEDVEDVDVKKGDTIYVSNNSEPSSWKIVCSKEAMKDTNIIGKCYRLNEIREKKEIIGTIKVRKGIVQ